MDNKKLTAALEKKAVYGNDIDLSSYSDSDKGSLKSVDDLSEATPRRKKKAAALRLCSLITMLWKLK